ncbi:pilus (MSHA type) biogenesis protein MshL [Campylobacter sp. MIT 21-1685]|uniref:pilus (MSHA type) biogenesis protein MshL n=1 Tax=unclassified Campylobacter TaxID=2593542 RepID=UPI00224A88EC|nr:MULTISPECIES: pilus (MSHA type) biogenesis protein MshL [unclassified Campylobacter]MCX2683248.1 pilus (MSHA type) biogenesis protein MshL [Campylobacter sp. MIT 21-1684]MCX2751559.1 pilus (MSHA type) biogenesis protein MshL [Campylobacter sp. MIT 21-1682]MCX2807758.1 pilus (MSHA type) biogenesis protein MshL [Campylobacter sp. MIT 21-1685]
MIKFLFISFYLCAEILYAIDCQNKLFDIHSISEKLSIEESLNELANYCSFSIVVKDKFAKEKLGQNQHSIHIQQASLDEIFKFFLNENNLYYKFDGKILKISALETKIFKMSYITSIREGQSITKASVDAKPKQTDYSISDDIEDNMIKSMEKFDFWQNIEKELIALLNSSAEEYEAKAPIINPNAGIIIATGTHSQLSRVKNYLQKLETRLKKQVIIDVNILAVSLNKSHSSGINWQNLTLLSHSQNQDGGDSFIELQNGKTFIKNLGFRANLNFNSLLNFLSESGKTNVLSSPKLMALNNQQAIISVGDTINYQVKESSKGTENGSVVSESFTNYSIFVGILLNILPEISDDNKIMLRISPSLSDFKYPEDNKKQKEARTIAPDTVQKKLSTVVQMENNQTLILGGLISHNKTQNESSVNFLSKIPLLGILFKGDEQNSNATEIVFIITPSIVDTTNSPSLKDLGFKL